MDTIVNLPIVAQVLMYVVAFNLLLSGLKASLQLIKDKTSTNVDNKVYDFVAKATEFITKALDVIGYNPKHK